MKTIQQEIIIDVLTKTTIVQFNIAINCYNIQGLYEKKKNYFVHTYFNGDVLKYSVTMRSIFDEFQTATQEQRAKQLNDKMYFLMKDIRLAKKFKNVENYSILSKEYNSMANEHNELNKGIVELTKLFKIIKALY